MDESNLVHGTGEQQSPAGFVRFGAGLAAQLPRIERLAPDHVAGAYGAVTLSIIGDDAKLFQRRAIKGVGGPEPEPVCWLVGTLGDVKVYTDNAGHVIVTRQNLYP